jgi:hypothetical protein
VFEANVCTPSLLRLKLRSQFFLLTGAGQAMISLLGMMHEDLGYDPHKTMSVGIPVHENTHGQWADRVQYFEQIRQRIGILHEVVSAAISTNATPPWNGWDSRIETYGNSDSQELQARINFVDSEYFSVLHIPVARGRLWTQDEIIRAAPAALVNQTLAHRFWPEGNAVGQRIRMPELKSQPPYQVAAPGSDGWFQIVGMVSDVRDDGLRNPVKPAVYLPYSTQLYMWTQILVRTKGSRWRY